MERNSGDDTACIMATTRTDAATTMAVTTHSIFPCTKRYISLFSRLNMGRTPFHQLNEVVFDVTVVLGEFQDHLARTA